MKILFINEKHEEKKIKEIRGGSVKSQSSWMHVCGWDLVFVFACVD